MDWEDRFKEIDQELESLIQELQGYDEAILNQPPREGKWSALQTMEHLLLSEELGIRYLEKKMSYHPKLKPANWLTAIKRALIWIYVKIPIPFSAPKMVATDQFPERSNAADLYQRYRAVRQRTYAFLAKQPREVLHSELYRHPISGLLDVKGLLLFYREHFRRHRKQIRRALAVVSR